jgi:hypothetical protein
MGFLPCGPGVSNNKVYPMNAGVVIAVFGEV